MCKRLSDQREAKSNFYAKLRHENVDKRHAIYEIDRDGRPDLIGFAARFTEGFMTFFSVDSRNEIHCSGLIEFPAIGNRGVAAFFDGDYAIPC